MKPAGLVSALVVAGGLALLPTASGAGSFTIVVSRGALDVSARGGLVASVAAGSLIFSSSGRIERFGLAGFDGPTYLIVDASPPDAQVFLDGRPLGTARGLVARALPLPPGRHAIEIVAPGFRPFVAEFTVASGSFPVRFRVALPSD